MSRIRRFARRLLPHVKPAAAVIGIQKGGTTALYQYLNLHPGVLTPTPKELHFFNCSARYQRGFAFYHSHFPLLTPATRSKVAVDTTGGYLDDAEHTAQRVHAYNPTLKLIVLLRDPVARAYSAWQMYRRRERGWFDQWTRECHANDPRYLPRPASFGESFERDVRDELETMERGEDIEMPIVPLGLYADALRPYLALFGRQQLLVIRSERMAQDTPGELRRVETFLDLPPHAWDETELRPRFVGGYGETVSAAGRALLQSFYDDRNRDLPVLLGEAGRDDVSPAPDRPPVP